MAGCAVAGLLATPPRTAAAHAAPGVAGVTGALAFMAERGVSLAGALPALPADRRHDVAFVIRRLDLLTAATARLPRLRAAGGGSYEDVGQQFISACSIHLPSPAMRVL